MSIKSKVLAAAATLTLVGGVGAASALTAGPAAAGTPSCGSSCLNISNKDFGPGSVVDVFRQSQKVGQPIILFRTANSDPAEDFTIAFQGRVSDFFAAGLVSSAVNLHFGGGAKGFPDLNAFEIEYAPFGVNSGLCMGVAATASAGEGVTLQSCGVSAKTVWIEDFLDVSATSFTNIPLINGSDTNFSHPFVLTYPAGANPVDKPRPQIVVANLTGFSQPGNGGVLPVISTVSSNQLWTGTLGVSP